MSKVIGTKGSWGRRILSDRVKVVNGIRYVYHVTKGWRKER
jgi:hypothetical protein